MFRKLLCHPKSGNLNFAAPGVLVFCVLGNCLLRCVLRRDWALDVDRYITALKLWSGCSHAPCTSLSQLRLSAVTCNKAPTSCPYIEICHLQPCSAALLCSCDHAFKHAALLPNNKTVKCETQLHLQVCVKLTVSDTPTWHQCCSRTWRSLTQRHLRESSSTV